MKLPEWYAATATRCPSTSTTVIPEDRPMTELDFDKLLYGMDQFTTAYVECALWSSVDFDTERPLDDDYGPEDIAPETLKRMVEDCAEFQEKHEDRIDGDEPRAGHDFWLTREGHGAGFWDGHWPEPGASVLTQAAKDFGSFELYTHDGKVWH